MLGEYKKEISIAKKQKLIANESIKNKWSSYLSDEINNDVKSYSVGEYLLDTNWGQESFYNDSCPDDPVTSNQCVVGCVGVALGQVLNYWGCRVFPDSSVSYTPNRFSSPESINFYDQNYNWDYIGNYSSATAQFLYHCAKAVESDFGDHDIGTESNNNFAWVALVSYFGFNANYPITKTSHTDIEWINLLKDEIDAERPVMYRGECDTCSVGHSWVVDGYDEYNKFHCNWGWTGSENDFYSLSDLTPYNEDYTSDQRAIVNIYPILDACSGLDGSEIVCSSNESYSVSIPSTASVEWGKSANLNQVGGNTGTTYTVNAASSGTGNVHVTIKNSQGETFLERGKYLWVGTPVIIGLDGPTYVPSDVDTRYYPLYGYDIASPTNFQWMITPDDGVNYNSLGWSTLVNFSYPDYYRIIYRGLNTCGWGDWYYSSLIQVYSSRSLSVTPNPTSGETIIAIETSDKKATSTAETEEMAFDETAEWELEIFDNIQNLIAKKTRLKGKEYKINTAGWIDGVYMIRVKYKDEVITGKLVVKG